MLELEFSDGGSDPGGLQFVKLGRPTRVDRTVSAGSSARVAENHEGRCAVDAPALGYVRTSRVFTDSIQFVRANDSTNVEEFFPARKAHF